MSFTEWMRDRDDRLAATKFKGRESATDRAARKAREKKQAGITKAARTGQAWEDEERRKNG